jgi:serine/threonine protein kinase
MELEAGVMVTSTVRLVRLLGQGGMGSVWVADHLTLKTEVAVKFLLADLVRSNPAMLARFEREASAAAQIKSPHVVATFDYGVVEDGTPYIVMELLDGESLSERVARTGPLSASETGQVLTQVAKALRKAHQLGIVHRDIKPDNLFLVDSGALGPDGQPIAEDLFVKVLDFGIAKQAEATDITHTGAMFGTPRFMSPEQLLNSKGVDFHADLWALAVVACWALTDRPPFDGETLAGISMAVCQGVFTPPSQLTPGLAPSLDAWFARAFDLNIQNRFPSAHEMTAAFADASAHPSAQPTAGAPPTGAGVAPTQGLSAPVAGPAPQHLQGPQGPLQHTAVQAPSLPYPVQASTLGPASATVQPGGIPERKWPLGATLGIAALVLVAGATGVFMNTRGESGPAGANSESQAEPTEPAAAPTLTTTETEPSASTAPPETATTAPSAPDPSSQPSAAAKPAVQPKTTRPTPPPKTKTNCNPPYRIDGKGVRRYKPECL